MGYVKLRKSLLAISVVFAPVLSRFLLLHHFNLSDSTSDWNGVASDVGTSLLLLVLIQAIFSGSSKVGLVKSVNIKVGHIVFTLMSDWPNSIAIDLVKPSTACLEALYTARS